MATVTIHGVRYEATVEGGRVEIFADGVWAGSAPYRKGRIVDCPAVLGGDQDTADEVYEALDQALRAEYPVRSITLTTGTCLWGLAEEIPSDEEDARMEIYTDECLRLVTEAHPGATVTVTHDASMVHGEQRATVRLWDEEAIGALRAEDDAKDAIRVCTNAAWETACEADVTVEAAS